MHKVWVCAIHGLSYAKYVVSAAIDTLCSKLWICSSINGLASRYFAQSMDYAHKILLCYEVTAYLRSHKANYSYP